MDNELLRVKFLTGKNTEQVHMTVLNYSVNLNPLLGLHTNRQKVKNEKK